MKSYLRFLTLLICILSGNAYALFSQDKAYQIFLDSHGDMTIEQIRAQSDALFETTHKGALGLIEQKHVWLKITLENSTNQSQRQVIHFEDAVIYNVDVFEFSNGQTTVYKSGSRIPLEQRPMPTLSPAFSIEVPAHQQKVVFAKITPEPQAIYYYSVYPDEFTFWKSQQSILLSVIPIAFLVIIFLIFTALAWLNRSKLFAIYSLFVAANILFHLNQTGLSNTLYWIEHAHLFSLQLVVLLQGLLSLFIIQVLQLRSTLPNAERIIRTIAYLSFSLLLVSLFTPLVLTHNGYGLFVPIALLIVLVTLLYAAHKQVPYTRYILLGSGLLIISGLIIDFTAKGLLYIPHSNTLFQYASLLETLVFSVLLLTQLYRKNQSEKQAFQQTTELLKKSQQIGEVGTWVFNPKTLTFVFDDYSQKKLHWSQPEVGFAELTQRFSDEDAAMAQDFLQRTLNGETIAPWIYQHHINEHESYWFESTWQAQLNADGEIDLIIGIDKDVTTQINTQQQHTLLLEAYQRLESASSSYSIIYDFDSDTFTVSDNIFAFYEIAPVENPSKELFFQFISPEGMALIGDIIQNPRNAAYSYAVTTATGKTKQVKEHLVFNSDKGQKILHVSVTDITEQFHAEQALQENLATLIKTQEIGRVGTWSLDLTSQIFVFDDFMKRLYQFEDKPFYSVPEVFAKIDSESQKIAAQAISDTIANKSGGKFTHIINSDQQYHIETIWDVELDSEGNAIRAIGLAKDITEQRLAQQKEREANRVIQKSNQIGKVGSWSFDVNTQTFYFDSYLQTKYGFEGPHVHANDVIARIRDDYKEEAYQHLQKALEGIGVESFVYCLDVAEQPEKWVEASWEVEYDAEGNILRVIGMDKDITEKMLAQQKEHEQEALLMHQNRLAQQGEMLQMIGHQWRQPLNVITLYMSLIRKKLKKAHEVPEMVLESIQHVEKTTQFMTQTIDDFKEFFSSEKTLSAFTPESLLDETLGILTARIEKHRIHIEKEFGDCAQQTIESYKSELNQVVLAIINNAIDVFETRQGEHQLTLSVHTEPNNDAVVINITDNAGGIPDEVMPFIFDPYFSTKKERNGTGLGLYMTKMIMEESVKGHICVANSEQGARFTLTIPTHLAELKDTQNKESDEI